MNLFSVFDPTSYFGISLNWIVIILILLFFPVRYYFLNGGYYKVFNIIKEVSVGTFKEVRFPNYIGLVYISFIIFLYLILRNLIGLFPFIFTFIAHPCITLGLGVVLWISFFSIGWVTGFKNRAAHLVPEGSPIVLSFLMVIIERVRHLIRPFTLSIRLAANIIAGHLIIGLLSRISLIGGKRFFISVFIQRILLILEFGVAVIQGFVFRILVLLYSLEYY